MLTLGIAGGLDAVHESGLDSPDFYTYDGAAVLMEDGNVVAAIEQERLDRIQHSNKFPLAAVQHCLRERGVRATDLAAIAYYVHEQAADSLLMRLYLNGPRRSPPHRARDLLARTLSGGLGCPIDPACLRFYQHQLTHAATAVAHDDSDEALVVVLDNFGGAFRGVRRPTSRIELELVTSLSPAHSVGRLVQAVLPIVGFGMFEQHKAVALAAHGDPTTFRRAMSELYELRPEGDYVLHPERAFGLLKLAPPPRYGEPFSQVHQDLAASLQEATEAIVLHLLAHLRRKTGLGRLCLAGGMAENTSVNGKILRSGLFDHVFVHPAAYDSGCALGAAILASWEAGSHAKAKGVTDVFWGGTVGATADVRRRLAEWAPCVAIADATGAAELAATIAEGATLGWVQGQSEFGSHALGHRTALADVRNAKNADRLRAALSREDDYRPPGLAVLEEDAPDLLVRPPATSLAYMSFAVEVREDKRALVAAALQRDGTARVYTVARATTPELWALLDAFKRITGVPALLSTSFNRGGEPTVETLDDAVDCFVHSQLDFLVAGDVVARRRPLSFEALRSFVVTLPAYVRQLRNNGLRERQRRAPRDELGTSYDRTARPISRELADLLMASGAECTIEALVAGVDEERRAAVQDELLALWSERLAVLRPGRRSGGGA